MALTSAQAQDILSKVTDISPGLFQESKSRPVGKMTCITFYCDTEGDDYNVLISNDKIIEISNSATKWGQAVIENILNPPAHQARNVVQGNIGAALANPTVAPSPYTNMPSVAPTHLIDVVALQHYISTFVTLNPGCVSSLFTAGALASEVPAQDPNAWTLQSIDINNNLYTFNMHCDNASDPNIASQVTAELVYDNNTKTFASISVEG